MMARLTTTWHSQTASSVRIGVKYEADGVKSTRVKDNS